MGPQVQPKWSWHPKHMRNNWELRKRGYLIRFGHTEALLFKKRTLNGHFSCPAETDPYVLHFTTAAPVSTHQNVPMFLNSWPRIPFGVCIQLERGGAPHLHEILQHIHLLFMEAFLRTSLLWDSSLLFIVSSNRLERISGTLNWNIRAHTFVNW